MKLLILSLFISAFYPLTASAELDEYYKYVKQYNQERNAFFDLKDRGKNGDVQAQLKVANMYFEGRPPGLPQNFKKAFKWFKMAADAGDMNAQYQVGVFSAGKMSEMIGIEPNEEQAKYYLEAAANAGHKDAQKVLVGMNLNGDFLAKKKNLVEAYKWAGLSVGYGENKDEDMEGALQAIEDMLTADELRRAKAVLKKAMAKRDASYGGMGAYGRQ